MANGPHRMHKGRKLTPMKYLDALFNTASAKKRTLDKDALVRLLNTTPEAVQKFEQQYAYHILDQTPIQKMDRSNTPDMDQPNTLGPIIEGIVCDLVDQTKITTIKDRQIQIKIPETRKEVRITPEQVNTLPEVWRPQLCGNAYVADTNGESWPTVLWMYQKFLETNDIMFYHRFRQGLDLLNLDSILYEILGINPNSMEHWLPQAAQAAWDSETFAIPNTTFIKVPLPILQMSRLQYETLTTSTLNIIDRFAEKVFALDDNKAYFVKTGIFSSKYDVRNAHIPAGPEVHELGEYLVCISNQATQMASPLLTPVQYGAATSRTWAVRDWIPDTQNNPTIYRGLPLRTEYRCFVDFDTKELLAIVPYWEPELMKSRFGKLADEDNLDMLHDYAIYGAHEKTLMNRYWESKDIVADKITTFLNHVENLTGQWSIDIMQDDQFYLIDMATADTSALSHFVPKGRLKKRYIDWRPQLN